MAAPPVPSNSNNCTRGWIGRARSLQNWVLILNTWACKSIKAVTSYPSITTGTSLEHPTNHAIGSGFKNGAGTTSCHPLFLAAFIRVGFGFGVRKGMLPVYWLLLVGSLTAFHWVHPSLFNVLAGVAHSLAMWPELWHLKHCSELGSPVFWALSWVPFGVWVLPLPWGTAFTWLATEELQVEVVWPRPVHPLWELGWVGLFLSVCPLLWPQCLGLFGALAGQLPCSALVRAAINLTIWSASSFEPSTTSVAVADLALTLSLASSILLSTLWAANINWE